MCVDGQIELQIAIDVSSKLDDLVGHSQSVPNLGAIFKPQCTIELDAKISHLKCPIGQTLAKSNEKWTSNLRTCKIWCSFSNPVSKTRPLSWSYREILTYCPLTFLTVVSNFRSLPLTFFSLHAETR